jgi:hypothetical protein
MNKFEKKNYYRKETINLIWTVKLKIIIIIIVILCIILCIIVNIIYIIINKCETNIVTIGRKKSNNVTPKSSTTTPQELGSSRGIRPKYLGYAIPRLEYLESSRGGRPKIRGSGKERQIQITLVWKDPRLRLYTRSPRYGLTKYYY